jgi:hypothetical protein
MEKEEPSGAGGKRFALYLGKLIPVLTTASQSSTPALSIYQANARQILFYLEGLARMYRNIHNRKRFERIRLVFKLLEDQLGKIDYYDSFVKELSVQQNFPPVLLENLRQHYSNEVSILDSLLKEKGWLGPDFTTIKTMQEELKTADWKSAAQDRKEAGQVMIEQIEYVETGYETGKLNFKTIENGVHEFRRQIRWISIYAQAVDGLIQLKQVDIPNPKLQVYLTKEIIENPFNKMPEAKERVEPIWIEAPGFYALSWMIEESGKLKDEGLRILCIEATLRETKFVAEKEVKPMTKKLAVNSKHSSRQIKETMQILADNFIDDAKVLKRIQRDIKRAIEK